MLHRLGFMRRSARLTPAQFSRYWRTRHASVALRMPGLTAYRQNHLVDRLGPTLASGFRSDGFSETWFETPGQSRLQDTDPDLFAELVADEKNFIGGLTGFVVEGERPVRAPASKIAVLRSGAAEHVAALLSDVAHRVGSPSLDLRVRADGQPLLERQGIPALRPMLEAVGVIRFESPDLARAGFAALAADEEWVRALPSSAQLLLTDEVRLL